MAFLIKWRAISVECNTNPTEDEIMLYIANTLTNWRKCSKNTRQFTRKAILN